ncbi:hypothetical protein AZI86_10030 [Bdellovibrio bacteriovorus]|uniref:Uncharacterized protein n=1 Tax=Bdellovibrio bacteriovorus TaxID=959 RepID=A0A150WSG6_BDEBC|nr:hypothetical protein [Bdellovibrio bacteriovorus]KYG67326.1 hypothetical protein AZI86_10030 [Bdellovibrio bacteriovorus]
MKKTFQLIIFSIFILSACAPAVEERDFGQAKQGFGPKTQDIDLSSDLRAFENEPVQLSWQGVVSTDSYFRQAENIVLLGQALQDSDLSQKGVSWIRHFYQQPQVTSYVDMAQSPFAAMAAAYTQTEVMGSLNQVADELAASRKTLNSTILNMGKRHPWPAKPTPLGTALQQVEDFTQNVLKAIPQMNLPAIISEGVSAELKKQTTPMFQQAQKSIVRLDEARSLSQTLKALDEALAQFGFEVPKTLRTSLQQGRQLGRSIDAAKDAQGGLTVLVDVWRMLSAQERASYFKPLSSSLYDFLSKQSDKDLQCLRTEGCSGGLFNGIAKKLFILPEIKKYGISQLQNEMNVKTKAYVLTDVRRYAQSYLPQIPGIFAQRIDAGLMKEASRLSSVQKDYPGYFGTLLSSWGKGKMPSQGGKIYGFETSNIQINLKSGSGLSLQASGAVEDLKAPTAGTSMSVNSLLMAHSPSGDSLAFQSALSQINKLISIGGYRDTNDKLIPALLSPVGHEKTPLDLMNFSANLNSYRIPDKIKLRDAFHANQNITYAKDFSASAFADQIKGLSEMLRITADWKNTSYDHLVGHIKAQELTNEIQSEALNRSLFPKDMLFALNIADVAVLLQDITKRATPVFLVSVDNNIVWADQYSTSDETAVMGGIVDIKDGKKSNIVRSKDVAQFLVAIATFLEATEGLENTRSPLLLEKDANGDTPLSLLRQGRADLKLLVVALANFISNQLVSENALIQSQYYLHQMTRSNNPVYNVEEQVISIRALLKAWQISKIDAYIWSAQEIYFAMNKQLFDGQEKFYLNGDKSALDFPMKVNTLLALMELKPHLPRASQIQLEKIAAPWLASLRSL